MSSHLLKPWEPEESIGTLWHRLIGAPVPRPRYPSAAVSLDSMRSRMGVLLRGLGGAPAMAIESASPQRTTSRRSFRQRIGHADELEIIPSCSAEQLNVPASLADFAEHHTNEDLYLWWAAWASAAKADPAPTKDPLQHDLERLSRNLARVRHILAIAPGLETTYRNLSEALLRQRSIKAGRHEEDVVEQLVRRALGESPATHVNESVAQLWDAVAGGHVQQIKRKAPAGYRPYAPVVLWPDWQAMGSSASHAEDPTPGNARNRPEGGVPPRRRARRLAAEQVKRPDPFILNRFETIKTWAELLNIGRRAEDDETDMARKAAEDQEELGLAAHEMKTASRLTFDLDLSPQDVERERLSTGLLYQEWDSRSACYLTDHVRVLEQVANDVGVDMLEGPSSAQRRRIAKVKRQFEALRPRTMLSSGEEEGSELDTEMAVRFRCDVKAGSHGNERLFCRLTGQARDLVVATLIDVSRSTESVVGERQVIEVAREALLALGLGLEATGDQHAIYAFSSLRRDRVFVSKLKGFSGGMDRQVLRNIAALKPGHYTRLGAAIRHVAAQLGKNGGTRRLLLVITDSKPNDIDYYEGRYGIEDTRRAVTEARMSGHAVFAITIDRSAETYVPHIFGRNGYAMVSNPDRLIDALPHIYRHLVT